VVRTSTRPDRVLADKAYDSICDRGYPVHVSEKADQIRNRKINGGPDGRHQRSTRRSTGRRYSVRCRINRLKRIRAGAARYDKLAVRYEARVQAAVINEWLRL
jgi:transposase